MTMGENIKKLREQNSMSQQELAEKCGKTQQAVDAWERNQAKPTATMIEKLASIFGVTPNVIFGFKNDQTDNPFFRVMQDAQEKGYSPEDIETALDILERARKRDNR